MGNTLLRTAVTVTASVLVSACSLFGAHQDSTPAAQPAAAPKDPWQAVKSDLGGTASGAALTTSSADDGSLKVALPDGSFDKGSSAIKVTIQPLLYQLSQCLGRHPEVHVNLVGYSDSSGDADFNIALSKNRARSVSEYLAAHNIDASRISVEGRGDADPVDDNGSPAGRARNRRVEIVLTQP